ncbi:serine/threonine-protein kinase pim-2-like [Cyprinodon tularosa]|uniref:serine/threonine-protein kinase pim-2-like n=1 Tax=Cyprinodon tularosa TaxID=77115 RepID=UPI0018E1E000|nr:serine/threonine-protein kinase pim-2-like [Cyprinodon tularosa]
METPAVVPGKQDNQSVSVGPSSRLDEPSCRKRKAEAVTEVDNKKLCKQSCNNFSRLTTGQDPSVSVEFVREYQKGKSNSTGRAPASIIVISSTSISLREPEEELEPIRDRKRKADVPEESSKKRQRVSEAEQGTSSSVSDKSEFERKYKRLGLIGRGGFGSVYAGLRLEDSLPVAIKYVDMRRAQIRLSEVDGVPLEVALMQKAGGGPDSAGEFAAVTLLEWFYVDQDLVIVMERPPASMDLVDYLSYRGGRLEEDVARILMKQMVDAAIDLHNKEIFHRDLKCENTLVEMGSQEPRIRIIDFGCGTFQTTKVYRSFSGTPAFAPPEWFSSRKYRPSPTTVWQLGIILYRMLHRCHFDTRRFTRGLIKFNKDLSKECLTFLALCLEEDSRIRATLEDLRAHPWLLSLRPVSQGSTGPLYK